MIHTQGHIVVNFRYVIFIVNQPVKFHGWTKAKPHNEKSREGIDTLAMYFKPIGNRHQLFKG